MTGFGLKRPGDGVAASFYKGILVNFFGGGVNMQSDVVACNDIPSAPPSRFGSGGSSSRPPSIVTDPWTAMTRTVRIRSGRVI